MNDNIKVDVVKAGKTSLFCNYIYKAIPLAFDESLSYYECLCALLNYLKNTIIPTVNNNADAVIELQQLFEKLQTYVNNYFDNLDVQDEINNKLDAMAEDGTLEKIVGDYAMKKLDYYKITLSTTEDEIIEIIENDGRAKVIEFENGVYNFTKTFHLKSNTTFLLNGSTLLNTTNDNLILGYTANDLFTGYDGIHNIKFENGYIGIPIALMHNLNISFNNIEFLKTLKTHAIQLGGCKNISITNCIFNGIVLNDVTGNITEMIQLETCTAAGQPFIPSTSPMFNNLGNFNIKIENCIFNSGDGVNSKFYVGIGHHGRNTDNLYSQENIYIRNNKFYNATYSAISIYGLNKCEISNNYFEMLNSGQDNMQVRLRGENKNVNIHNNEFNGYLSAIGNVSIQQIENIKIYNNQFTPSQFTNLAIGLNGFKNIQIYNNYIKCNKVGIQLAPYNDILSDNAIIHDNYFEKTESNNSYMINVYANTNNLKIYNNTIKQLDNTPFTYYRPGNDEENKPLLYANNYIINNNSTPNDINANNSNMKYLFNSLNTYYSANASSFVKIENQPVNHPLSNFNRLHVCLAMLHDSKYIYLYELTPYNIYGKFNVESSAREYIFTVSDASNNTHQASLTLNQDGTFSFDSDGQIVLINLSAYNVLLR